MTTPASLPSLKLDAQGLIPAIAQDRLTGEVRMLAWMNLSALEATLKTQKATFYSRSRQSLWVKGETSKNVLWVHEILVDCDGDTLLLLCDPEGPSCHTGEESCFFQRLDASPSSPDADRGAARPLLGELERILEARKQSTGAQSYTRSLFDGGVPKIGAKIQEEAGELVQALAEESDERAASEAADLVYHLLVGLRHRNVPWRAVLKALAKRLGTSGHAEKASRVP